MALTLTATVDANAGEIAITGTVPDEITAGQYRFRLSGSDEIMDLVGFAPVRPPRTWPVNRNAWVIARGVLDTIPTSHTMSATVEAIVDAFVASDTETPPDPVPAGATPTAADVTIAPIPALPDATDVQGALEGLAGAARVLGPFHVSHDTADIPGVCELYSLTGFGVFQSTAVSGSFDLRVDAHPPVTLQWNATRAQVQAALESVVGVGNVECTDPFGINAFAVHECLVLFTGTLDYTAVSLTVENDTTDTMAVSATEVTAGSNTPRLGRILFTPRVGDVILSIHSLVSEVFNDSANAFFGDTARMDPGAFGGSYLDLTPPGLVGDGAQWLPLNEITDLPIGAFGKTPSTGTGFWSQDADRTKWDSAFSVVRKAVPFAVALGDSSGGSTTPSTGETDLYVRVATPSATY